jgi:RHS repeat-associated protein
LFYDAGHQRYKQIASYSGSPETTTYVGGLLEKVANSTGTGYRHYIPAGNIFVVYIRLSTGSNSTYYVTKDNLGSSDVITDSSGTLIVKEKFGALGAIENSAGDQATIATISRHEFTGQELMDNTGILFTNMNGRVYTPSGSMFLSPDPYIADPGNTQNFNRYGYVYNNPLTNTDPSGFFTLGDLLNPFSNNNPLNPFGRFGRKLALAPFTTGYDSYRFFERTSDDLLRDYKWLQPIAEIAACYYGGPYACAAADAKLTRLNGGTVDQALVAGVTSLAFQGANDYVDSQGLNEWANVPIKGVISGATAAANGGSFRTGFFYGAAGEAAYGIYASLTYETNPTWNPGGEAVSKVPATDAEYEPADPAWNNVGIATPYPDAQAGQWWPITEGSVISNFLNQIPGFNSVATLHDYINTGISGFWNVPTMVPAFILNYAALSGSIPLCATGRGSPCR